MYFAGMNLEEASKKCSLGKKFYTRIALSEFTNVRIRRVAKAFDLAGITNPVGCPVLSVLGEGRAPRPHTHLRRD